MENSQTRERVSNLLEQLNQLVGIPSPLASARGCIQPSLPSTVTGGNVQNEQPSSAAAGGFFRSNLHPPSTTIISAEHTGPQTNQERATFVRAEARQLFAPYPRMLSPRYRLAGRSAGAPRFGLQRNLPRQITPAPVATTTWTQKFCCLSGPSDVLTPDPTRKITLNELGLGEEVVVYRKQTLCTYGLVDASII